MAERKENVCKDDAPGSFFRMVREGGKRNGSRKGKRLSFRENRLKSSTADFSRITRRISDENDKMSKTDWGLPEDVFPVTKEHCGRESGGAYIHKKKDFACYTENILKIYLFLSTFFSIFALVLLRSYFSWRGRMVPVP